MAVINGTTGDDTLAGTPQDDTITTLSGTDIVNADAVIPPFLVGV